MPDLKPCPFCGSAVDMDEIRPDAVSVFYGFMCDSCGMYTTQNYQIPKEKAINAWNRRAGEEDKHETD